METPVTNSLRRPLIAAAIGATVMAGAIVSIGFGANAQSTQTAPAQESATTTAPEATTVPLPPSTTIAFDDGDWAEYDVDWAEYEECMAESGVYEQYDENGDWNEEDYEAMDAQWAEAEAECSLLLPEHIQAENAAWQAHSECVEEILGVSFYEEEDWNEQAWTDADRECRKVLPEEMRAEMEAWDAYQDCTNEIVGFHDGYSQSGYVSVEANGSYDSMNFGDGDGTITITKVDGEISISTEGDVVWQDETYWAAQDELWMQAEESCQHLMPEDMFG